MQNYEVDEDTRKAHGAWFGDGLIEPGVEGAPLADQAPHVECGSIADMAVACGFRDETEMFRMIAAVDLTAGGALAAFRKWQDEDGSRAGLVDTFPYLSS